jgi:hypothetical protein
LRERGAGVLADFDFASEGGEKAIVADVQPGGNLFRKLWGLDARAGSGLLSCEGVLGYCKDGDASA